MPALVCLDERKGDAGRPRKGDQDLPAFQRPRLVSVRLHRGVADRDLPVAAEGDVPVASHGEDRRAMDRRHGLRPGDELDGTPSSIVPPTYEYTPAWY